MKISIELDGFSLRILAAISLAISAAFWGAGGVVLDAISLYLILKG